MNSSSNLPPKGLLLRLRVIGQEWNGGGAGSALSSLILSSSTHLGGGQKWEGEGDCPGWIFSSPMGRTDRQSLEEVIPRAGLQEEPAPYSGTSSLPKGASSLGGLQEASYPPRIPVSHQVE